MVKVKEKVINVSHSSGSVLIGDYKLGHAHLPKCEAINRKVSQTCDHCWVAEGVGYVILQTTDAPRMCAAIHVQKSIILEFRVLL